jgi:Lipase (class 3)
MLTRVINPDNSLNTLGILQAWTAIFSLYQNRPEGIQALIDRPRGEFIQQIYLPGIDGQDGGIAIVWSQDQVFIFIGPASGLTDYTEWALTGVPAVANLTPQAWVNSLWSSFLDNLIATVRAQLAIISQPGRTVQIAGFSQGGAMATMLGRALSQQVNPYNVEVVGFGAPRSIANSFLPAVNEKTVRLTNQSDPVDLVPPTYECRPEGGPFPGLAIPTAWANYGTRFVMDGAGVISAVPDAPSPDLVTLTFLLAQNIGQHTPGAYSATVQAAYGKSGLDGGDAAASASYILGQLVAGERIVVFGPQQTKVPELPPPVIVPPVQPGNQQFLIQEMVIPVPPSPAEQFLIQEMIRPGFSSPPSLTIDPG